ncbi:SLC13 family permease, partial [Escherichia sp. HC-CC]
MNGELIWVLSLLAVAIVLFATGRVRMDAVALFVIVAFALSGTLTVPEVFSGFSDPNVVLIAALFIIGNGVSELIVQAMQALLNSGDEML